MKGKATYDMVCISDDERQASCVTSICQFCTYYIPNLGYSIYHHKNDDGTFRGHRHVRGILLRHVKTDKYSHRIFHYCGTIFRPQSKHSLLRNLSSNWIKVLANNRDDTWSLLHEMDRSLIYNDKKYDYNRSAPILMYILDLVSNSNQMTIELEEHYHKLSSLLRAQRLFVIGSITQKDAPDLTVFSCFLSDPASAYMKYMMHQANAYYIDGHLFLPDSSKHKLYEILIQSLREIMHKKGIIIIIEDNVEEDHMILLNRLFAAHLLYARYCSLHQDHYSFISFPSLRSCLSHDCETMWIEMDDKLRNFFIKCKNMQYEMAKNLHMQLLSSL